MNAIPREREASLWISWSKKKKKMPGWIFAKFGRYVWGLSVVYWLSLNSPKSRLWGGQGGHYLEIQEAQWGSGEGTKAWSGNKQVEYVSELFHWGEKLGYFPTNSRSVPVVKLLAQLPGTQPCLWPDRVLRQGDMDAGLGRGGGPCSCLRPLQNIHYIVSVYIWHPRCTYLYSREYISVHICILHMYISVF